MLPSDIEVETGRGVWLWLRRGFSLISYPSCSTPLVQLSYSDTFTVLRSRNMPDP